MSGLLSEETTQLFDAIAGILLRCFLFTVGASLFVWVVVLLMGDTIYQIYTILIDMSRQDYHQFILYSLTLVKVLSVLFFLIPFLAIKHFLASKSRKT